MLMKAVSNRGNIMFKERVETPCPVCDQKNVITHWSKPIDYWGCRNCNSVFVHDSEGILSVLDIDILYIPKE